MCGGSECTTKNHAAAAACAAHSMLNTTASMVIAGSRMAVLHMVAAMMAADQHFQLSSARLALWWLCREQDGGSACSGILHGVPDQH